MSYSEKPCISMQFVRTDVVADPVHAATVRREFSEWCAALHPRRDEDQ